MKQRFLSIFTVVALMASVIAGAMSVSLNYAKASVPAAGYFDDLVSEASVYVPSDKVLDFTSHINEIKSKLNDAHSAVFVICDSSHTKFYFGYYMVTSGTDMQQFYWYSDGTNLRFRRYNNQVSYAFFLGSAVCVFDTYQSFSYSGSSLANSSFNTSTFGTNTNALYYPSPSYCTSSDIECYSTVHIYKNDGIYNDTNLYSGSSPVPPTPTFDLGVFWLGNRQYLSILQQDIMRDLDPEHLNDAELIVYLYNSGEGDYKSFTYSDVTLLPGDWQFFVNLAFTNVSPAGLYVIDITGNEWDIITGAEIYDSDSFPDPYAISESRIEMSQGVPGTDGTPDTYTQTFNYFSEYVNNYNQTHVIPENLAETLFGANGSKLYPCIISEPTNIANTASGSDVVTTQGLHTFKWSMVEPDHLGYNYDLFDTVIVPSSLLGYYGLVYFYDDTLQKPFQFIDVVSFGTLLEEFDCIIIVPDDQNTLEENTWWSNLLPSGLSGFDDMAVSGSSSLGIEYVDDAAIGNNYQGFVIVTRRAIQKQQLFVFNDGITKTYKLMSDYIEKRGDWEDSFLTWTASLFSQWQTLDGKLGDIYNLLYGWNLSSVLSDISESLARIANNTSEEDPGYWFLSLFNWLNRFSVTDSDFANWVSEYDDFTDDLPDPGSGATVIPFPTVIPTVAVGG